MPRVSVIVPCYNHGKYIEKTIQSILEQTFQDFEVIIIDDGSSDDSVEKIGGMCDPRIKSIYHEKNLGGSIAVRRGIEEAGGEYLSLVSADDICLPEKIKEQVEFLDANPQIVAVFGQAELIDENGNCYTKKEHFYVNKFQQQNRSRFEWLNHFFFKGNCICHPSMLIRRKCYDEIGVYEESYAQLPDLDFWIRLCKRHEIFILQKPLIQFRVRDNEENISGDKPENRIRSAYELEKSLKHYLTIKSTEDLAAIFPDAPIPPKMPVELIPFVVAQIALEQPSVVYKHFAINTWYDLMADRKTAEKIERCFSFKHIDLIKIAARHDVYGLIKDYSYFYIDTGTGFTETKIKKTPIVKERLNFCIPLDLKEYAKVKQVRWDLYHGVFCEVEIEAITFRTSGGYGGEIDLAQLNCNGEKKSSKRILFNTLNPSIAITMPDDVVSIMIKGAWRFWTEQEIEVWLNKIRREEKAVRAELNAVYQSDAYRWLVKWERFKGKTMKLIKMFKKVTR